MIITGTCLQVSRRCNIVIKSEVEHAQHLPVEVWRSASRPAGGAEGRKDICVRWGRQCVNNNNTGNRKPVTVRCHFASLSHPTIFFNLWSIFSGSSASFRTLGVFFFRKLTFRVSRRLISRFSSISSCSLRAAEQALATKKKSYTAGTSVLKLVKGKERFA